MERIIKILKEKMIIDTLREMLDNSNLVKLKINLNDSQKLEFIQIAILQEDRSNLEFALVDTNFRLTCMELKDEGILE